MARAKSMSFIVRCKPTPVGQRQYWDVTNECEVPREFATRMPLDEAKRWKAKVGVEIERVA